MTARSITITYGAFSVGQVQTNTDVHLTDKMSLDITYETVRVTFRLHVISGSSGALLTAENALKAAYRNIDVPLIVLIGGVPRVSLNPGANTGFLTRASLSKPGDAFDTETSSMWDIEIVGQLPADKSDRDGRQQAVVSIAETPSGVRMATFTGVFTALSTNSAREQFEASVANWIGPVLAAIGGFWQKRQTAEYRFDDQDKILNFVEIYEEILLPESLSQLNHPAIRSQSMVFDLADYGGRRSIYYPEAVELSSVRVAFRCSVVKSVTTDLTALYRDTIKPNILRVFAPLGGLIVVAESVTPDLTENTISVAIEALVSRSGVVRARLNHRSYRTTGSVLSPAWDGNPFAKDVDEGLADEVHEVLWSITHASHARPPLRGRPPFLEPPEYVLRSTMDDSETYIVGRVNGQEMTLTDYVVLETWDRVDQPYRAQRPPPPLGATTGGQRPVTSSGSANEGPLQNPVEGPTAPVDDDPY